MGALSVREGAIKSRGEIQISDSEINRPEADGGVSAGGCHRSDGTPRKWRRPLHDCSMVIRFVTAASTGRRPRSRVKAALREPIAGRDRPAAHLGAPSVPFPPTRGGSRRSWSVVSSRYRFSQCSDILLSPVWELPQISISVIVVYQAIWQASSPVCLFM